jgi:hypothetical protein
MEVMILKEERTGKGKKVKKNKTLSNGRNTEQKTQELRKQEMRE